MYTNRLQQVFLLLALLGCWLLVSCSNESAVTEFTPTNQAGDPLTLTVPTNTGTTTAVATGIVATPTLHPVLPTPTHAQTAAVPTPAAAIIVTLPAPATPAAMADLLIQTEAALAVGDYTKAIDRTYDALERDEAPNFALQIDLLNNLGLAYLRDGNNNDAVTIFNQLAALAEEKTPLEVYFHLAEANAALGEHQAAIAAYEQYLAQNADLAAYVYPRIADAYLALGEQDAALTAYEAALTGHSQRFREVETRLILAEYALAAGDTATAVAQYDAIHDVAQTENTKGQMTYLAGAAELLADNPEEAYARFLFGLENYPAAYESYLGLVELVKADVPVDEYQRGLVDYEAAAYQPGIEAFERVIAANPDGYEPQVHQYMAWSYEALGDFESALAQWELYAATEPAIAALDQAKLLARIGETETAVAAYTEFIETYPENEQIPFAVWSLAQLSEQLGDVATAVDLYVSLADNTPDNANAAEALVIAGQLNYDNEAPEAALILWQRAATEYPDSDFGAAAMVRLLRLLPEEQNELRATIQALAKANTTTGYAGWRARDLANDFPPFFSLPPFEQPENEVAAYQEVEAWLETELELDKGTVLSEFGPELQNDPRLIIGEQLWNLGLMSDAQLEFNDLRANYAADAVASYQLALYLHDLGLYRSAIGAAETVLRLTGQSVLEAPPLIGRLAYPIPFADLIVPLAEEYDYDPRLQWALIRQESLFDTIARSSAAAQGLSQVIPDTGAWIAQRLQWPDYENDDLYKPHVGLTFGAYYLSQQLSDFDNTVHAALSAYNAGPGNAYRWYETAVDDIDLYVATVDFPETRTYIERIYAGYDIYRYLYVSSNGG